MNRTLIFTLALLAVASAGNANPRTKAQIEQIASKSLASNGITRRAPGQKLQRINANAVYSIYGYKQGGYVIVSNDDVLPEVLAYSDGAFDKDNLPDGLRWWLSAMTNTGAQLIKKNVAQSPVAPNPDRYAASVAPLVTAQWGQEKPYNDQCPVAYSTASHRAARSVTGCVATAMAQIMKYYKYPAQGKGTASVSYYWPDAPGHAKTATVDFSQATYDWDNMLDTYTNVDYSKAQGDAVAQLMYHCGVAANMSYDPDGSGAYTANAAYGLRNNFGYASTVRVATRSSYDIRPWMDLVYTELSASRPILYTGNDVKTGYGHAFVVDGYTAEGLVHVNWGWDGLDNGYYDISLLDPKTQGMQFANYQDMIIGIQTTEPEKLSATVNVTAPGTLLSSLDADKLYSYNTVSVKGNINSTDLKALRNLAGVDSTGHGTLGTLANIDLSGAKIVAGGEPFLIDGDKQLTTADGELPERAFYNAQALDTLKLPALKHIGDGAFGNCPSLQQVSLTTADGADFNFADNILTTADGKELIEVMPYANGNIELAEGTTTLRPYALAGCSKVAKVTFPSTLRTVGQKAFSSCYKLVEIRSGLTTPPTAGDNAFEDSPVENCKLYVPAGSKKAYKKASQWSEFVGETADGAQFDNIIEYGTSIEARNKIRKYGEENPKFTYKVNGDTPTGEPVLTCEATKTSPVGHYAIVPSRGTITGDDVYFINGTLVVTAAPLTVKALDATRPYGKENPEFVLSYDGFVNGDTASTAFTELPVITCEATPDSPVGDYPIVVSGGTAQNYKLSYVAGTLHVEAVTDGISEVKSSANDSRNDVYTISGVKVRSGAASPDGLKAGVYIIGNKKVIVK